jgi:hypothetical protein
MVFIIPSEDKPMARQLKLSIFNSQDLFQNKINKADNKPGDKSPEVGTVSIWYPYHMTKNVAIYRSKLILCRSQWPCSLRCRSAAAWLLGSQFESRSGHGCLSVAFICCVVLCRQRSLRRADHSSRGVLPCVCMCDQKTRKGRPKFHPGL